MRVGTRRHASRQWSERIGGNFTRLRVERPDTAEPHRVWRPLPSPYSSAESFPQTAEHRRALLPSHQRSVHPGKGFEAPCRFPLSRKVVPPYLHSRGDSSSFSTRRTSNAYVDPEEPFAPPCSN